MTVVVVLSDCPPKLRGDMTKWFIEINTGVYVGNMSARVRDEVWDRITDNIGRGHATMVFSSSGEQHMDFRVHNAYWEPVDFDGIKLMRRPERASLSATGSTLKPGFSSASKRRMISNVRAAKCDVSRFFVPNYVVLDLETTGLDDAHDDIIEIAALLVEHDTVTETLHLMVSREEPLPQAIAELTGITDDLLDSEGISPEDAIEALLEFAEDLPLVCHNAGFEQAFLNAACRRLDVELMENHFIDTLLLSRTMLPELPSHKLSALAELFDIKSDECHRALPDCQMTFELYVKLKGLAKSSVE